MASKTATGPTRRLGDLKPGTRFRLAALPIEGELVEVGAGGATVALGGQKRAFETSAGNRVEFVRRRRTTWSKDAQVIALTEQGSR